MDPHRHLPEGTRLPSTGRQEQQALTDSFLRGQGCPLQADKNNGPSQTASSGDKAALYRQTRTTGPHRQLPQGTRLPSTGRQEQQVLTDSFLRGQGCPLQADKNNGPSQTASSGDKAALYRQTRTTGPHRQLPEGTRLPSTGRQQRALTDSFLRGQGCPLQADNNRPSQTASSGDKAALYRQTRTTGPHRQLPERTRMPSTGRQEQQALTDSFLMGQGCPLQADKKWALVTQWTLILQGLGGYSLVNTTLILHKL